MRDLLANQRTTLAPSSMRAVASVAAGMLMLAAPAAAQDAGDRTIVPGERVGAIVKNSTTAQIKRVYGARNVRPHKVPVGEGETVEGLIVYPGKRDELMLIWKVKDRQVEQVRIDKKGSTWRTASGIGMGTAAAALTRLNGGPFSITGFGWDYAGRVVDWRNGKLPKALMVDMMPTKTLSQALEQSVLGDKIFPSNNPVMEKKKLVVRGMIIWFE